MLFKPFQKISPLLLLIPLIWGLAACGGTSEAPPTATLEAPLNETVEVEAPATSETAPESAESNDATTFELREPVSLAEAVKAIDMREAPRLDGAQVMIQEVGQLHYSAPVEIGEAAEFYQAELSRRDWIEQTESTYIEAEYAQLSFTKNDFYLSLSILPNYQDESLVDVTLQNHGNVDVRALPVFPEAEWLAANSQMTAIYVTPVAVAEVVDFTRQELAAQGWHEYIRPNTGYADDPDNKTLAFKQNGVGLTAYIAVAPAQDGKTTTQYSVVLLSNELPTMVEATEVEFDEHEPYLSHLTPADIETATGFYRQELAALGWEEISEMENITPEQAALVFTDRQRVLSLSVAPAGDGQTQVVLQTAEAEELAEPVTTEPDVQELGVESLVGAPDLPLPEDAQAVEYEADFEQISYTSPADIETLVEFHRQALAAEGWQEDETFSIVEESFGSLFFEKDEASLDFTFFNFNNETEVTISTSGLAWGDSLPTGESETTSSDVTETVVMGDDTPTDPRFNPEAWPVPAEAQEVERDRDEVDFVIDWDYAAIGEFYTPILTELGFETDCFNEAAEYTSYSCSIGQNGLSLSIHLFEKFDGRIEVGFSFYDFNSETDGATDTTGTMAVTLENDEGLPVPSNFDSSGSEGSEFRKTLQGSSAADVIALVELYRSELPAMGWTEQTGAADVADDQATLTFESDEGPLTIELSRSGTQTELTLSAKYPKKAQEIGILPAAGQARIYFGNIDPAEVSLTIDQQTLKIKTVDPQAGPEDMAKLDLAPGEYSYTLSVPGEAEVTETIEVGPDEVWMLMLGAGGGLSLQVY